jgi:hypothetical protein
VKVLSAFTLMVLFFRYRPGRVSVEFHATFLLSGKTEGTRKVPLKGSGMPFSGSSDWSQAFSER